eukprot:TRINITY_DN5090_c0_g1_i1.p1 TRINITY_DN5090_c0_g1~~TRINITY_DN5090_c0_g1_i1.p1  ORF type:complete len:1032 (+),score=227.04 TRINITY_DN5090_c0_g1_i1:52-3147(+)
MSDDGSGLVGRRNTLPMRGTSPSIGRFSSGLPGLSMGRTGSRMSVSSMRTDEMRTKSGLIRKQLERLDADCHVKAMVRVRPLLEGEEDEGCVEVRGDEVVLIDPKTSRERDAFIFDKTFPQSTPSEEVNTYVGDSIITASLQGFNSCVFTFGQTNSGKTHTMLGTDSEPGLIPSVITELFRKMETHSRQQQPPPAPPSNLNLSTSSFMSSVIPVVSPPETPLKLPNGVAKEETIFEVSCCFMEIYKERVRDLLLGSDEFRELKIRNSPANGPYVEGLTFVPASSPQQLLDLVRKGGSERTIGSTTLNERSSRSHAVFQIIVTQTDAVDSSQTTTLTKSRINLVDLAGSEKATASCDIEETTSINLSLTTLRRVIDALIENSKKPGQAILPPYRESKLTWLLSESLGGNSKTVMIGTISPSTSCYDETLNTLRYTLKARGIVNRISKNEDKHLALIRLLRSEISNLQARVAEQESIMDLSTGLHAALSSTSLTPREIDETMDVSELKRQVQIRNKIIEELNLRGATGSGRNGFKDTGVQAVEHALSAHVTIVTTVDSACKHIELRRAELTAAISEATGVPTDCIIDMFLEAATDNTTRASCVCTANPTLLNKNKVKQVSLMRKSGFDTLDFNMTVSEVSSANFLDASVNPVLALSPKGLQGQLLAEQREKTELNQKVRMLQHTVEKLKRVEANQAQVFESMAKETESLCSIIREKNDENLQLSSTVDQLMSQNAALHREIEELREGKENAERQGRAINLMAGSTEEACTTYQERLFSVTAALEQKIKVTQKLSNEIGELREENKVLRRQVEEKEEEFGEEASLAASRISGLVNTNTEIEAKLQVEKEARMRLGEERRQLTIQCDQLKRDHDRLLSLLSKRGLVLVGSGTTQQLMRQSSSAPRRSFTPPAIPPALYAYHSESSVDQLTPFAHRRSQSASLPRATPPRSAYSPRVVSSEWFRPASPNTEKPWKQQPRSMAVVSPSIRQSRSRSAQSFRPATPPHLVSARAIHSLASASQALMNGGRVPMIHKKR